MADFRKWILVLTALTLFAGLASAQSGTGQLTCNATAAVPPQLRGEGYTELVGDILLTCTGGASSAGQTFNVTVYLPATVTSRLLPPATGTTSIAGQTPSEALLLINDPGGINGGTQSFCNAPFNGAGPGGCVGGYSATLNNVYEGVSSGGSETFFGIPVVPAITTGFTTTYRITDVRMNATALNSGAFSGVTANVAISGSTSVTLNNSLLTVGYVATSLSTSISAGTSTKFGASSLKFNQCQTASVTTPLEVVHFSELQGSAFKSRGATNQNVPGVIYGTESGFTPTSGPTLSSVSGTVSAGLADWGTRLKAVFNNIPSGVTIYVSTTNLNSTDNAPMFTNSQTPPAGSTYAQLIVSETSPDSGAMPPLLTQTGITSTTATGIAYVALNTVNNSASAVWEVTDALANTLESADFAVFLSYSAATATNSPSIGSMTVNLSYAPVPDATDGITTVTGPLASSVLGIPRFMDTSTATTALTIQICQTALLFPYVTETGGFDTGLAIANTSADVFGTSAQNGYCTISWFGNVNGGTTGTSTGYLGGAGYQATLPTSSQLIGAGSVAAFATSVANAGFTGYVIAVCNFQYAHGFAFVSDLGARNLAMGYLADIIGGTIGTGRTAPVPSEVSGQ